MRRISKSWLVTLSAVAILAAACGDVGVEETTTTPSSSTTSMEATTTSVATTTNSSTTTTQATTTTTDEPLDPVGEAQTDPLVTDGFPGTGETAFLTDVRLGRHEGFERLVFEFDEAAPEYRIEYTDGPVTESPSGNEIEVEGDTYLSVTMSPATSFDRSEDTPEETYEGPDRLGSDDTLAIEEIVRTEDFENVTSWVVGMDDALPFGAIILDNPFRLVIDIRTE